MSCPVNKAHRVDRRAFLFAGTAVVLSSGAVLAAADATRSATAEPSHPTSAATGKRPHVIRHFVLATANLEKVSARLQSFLAIPQGVRHDMSEALGFRNEMMKIGNTMLELVQPIKPDHRLHRWLAERGGDGGYMIVLQTFDANALRSRAAAEKLRLTRDMQFRGQQMVQFDPRHFGAHFEAYEYSLPDGWWGDPNGRNYGKSEHASEIVAAEVAVEEPERIAAQIGRLYESPVASNTVTFVDKRVRFVAARPPWRGLVGLDLIATNRTHAGRAELIGGVNCRLI
jgi:hypothetical protein